MIHSQDSNSQERAGALVYWASTKLDWLRGRGQTLCLIQMLDLSSGRLFARFVDRASTAGNLAVLKAYLKRFGRPLEFRTRESSQFVTAPRKTQISKTPSPTKIARALADLGIAWTCRGSGPDDEQVDRVLAQAQKELRQAIREARVRNLTQANACLEKTFLPQWEASLPSPPAGRRDVHRPLGEGDDLDAILCAGVERYVTRDCTVQYRRRTYRVAGKDGLPVPAEALIRLEMSPKGKLVAFSDGRRLSLTLIDPARSPSFSAERKRPARPPKARTRTSWMRRFFMGGGPTLEEAIARSNASHYVTRK